MYIEVGTLLIVKKMKNILIVLWARGLIMLINILYRIVLYLDRQTGLTTQ